MILEDNLKNENKPKNQKDLKNYDNLKNKNTVSDWNFVPNIYLTKTLITIDLSLRRLFFTDNIRYVSEINLQMLVSDHFQEYLLYSFIISTGIWPLVLSLLPNTDSYIPKQ